MLYNPQSPEFVLTLQGLQLGQCRGACRHAALVRLLQAFRSRGHLAADLDPLQRQRGPWFREGRHVPSWRWAGCWGIASATDAALHTSMRHAWQVASMQLSVHATRYGGD